MGADGGKIAPLRLFSHLGTTLDDRSMTAHVQPPTAVAAHAGRRRSPCSPAAAYVAPARLQPEPGMAEKAHGAHTNQTTTPKQTQYHHHGAHTPKPQALTT